VEPVRVVGMKAAWGLASPSPFCLKLETWLRMTGIPYETVALAKPPQSSTGKVPYLLLDDGGILADSNVIIATLSAARGLDPAAGLSPEDLGRSHAVLRLVEESLYFVGVWERWMLPACWPVSRDAYFGSLPAGVRGLVAGLVRRKVKAALHGQGILRLDPARIAAHGAADVQALSNLLGQRPYFAGERPGVADASAYGMLANGLAFPVRTPMREAVEASPNLVGFCRRIERAYWQDGAAVRAGNP
jgi:glutathione S-transferase